MNLNKKSFNLAAILALVVIFAIPVNAMNGALLDLLKILYDKGSLTAQEYESLVNAARADEEKIADPAVNAKQVITEEIAVPDQASVWTDKIQIKGDIRTRYQGQWEDGAIDRNRGRIRYRLGIVANPVENWDVGSGLASGSDDLRSTNQSFDETFSRKAINLDYAYAQYAFNDTIKAIAGKLLYKAYLHKTTDLMWDNDINPEGFSMNYTGANNLGTTFVNGGIWILEENGGSEDDPFMAYGQLGHKFSVGALSGSVSGTYYDFSEINSRGDIATDSTITNSDYRFDAVSLSGELGLPDVIGEGSKISVFGDWVMNTDTVTAQDTGFSAGLSAAKGPWEFSYIYADLEENAWPDILPDSDRFDGLTGVHGHELIFNYLAWKNVTMGLDYYLMENAADISQNLLQVDVTVKF